MGKMVRTFFTREDIQPEQNSSDSSELNVVKRNYLFEDSVKDETESANHKPDHILIECIKNTAAARELQTPSQP